jgi:Tol biopolymer transport system component
MPVYREMQSVAVLQGRITIGSLRSRNTCGDQENAMARPSLEIPPPEKRQEKRLDSWKEIAAYLNRDITTVQRWEKREGMPVHRYLHDKRGSVYASPAELDAWAQSRNLPEAQENGNDTEQSSITAVPRDPARPTRKILWRWVLIAAAALAALLIGAGLWVQRTEYFWHSPIENARFQTVTDFGGAEQAAAVSRDGHFIAFLSDRDGQMDVWVTQVGSGQFHNLTRGSAPELINPSVRTLGFSPDGSLVTFWARKQDASHKNDIGVWAVPTLGGEPRPYLENAAEFDWTTDSSRLAYHTPEAGDPLFVSDGNLHPGATPIFTAAPGLHAHFPLWSPDAKFIYFVQGSVPDKLDLWRIPSGGGVPEKITSHNTQVIYPVLLNRRTLMYLATDPDGSGPWLYSIDVEHRIPHRLTSNLDRYTSLAISADGRRLVATLASPKRTLWRLLIADPHTQPGAPAPIPLTTGAGFSPRLGPDYLLYVSATNRGESLWKLTGKESTELWRGQGARVVGGPTISPDRRYIAFTVKQREQTLLYVMQSDATNARVITNSLNLLGDPAWAPDGQSITSAVVKSGVPQLFRIPLHAGPPTPVVHEYSINPAWSSDGQFLVYSGPDIGTMFSVKAVAQTAAHPLPRITLTRGARHVAFMPGGHALLILRGDIQHKDLWLVNLDTGVETQLTNLPPEFDIRDFDISPDGREVVLERVQARSDIVLMDLPQR